MSLSTMITCSLTVTKGGVVNTLHMSQGTAYLVWLLFLPASRTCQSLTHHHATFVAVLQIFCSHPSLSV